MIKTYFLGFCILLGIICIPTIFYIIGRSNNDFEAMDISAFIGIIFSGALGLILTNVLGWW